MSLLSLSLANIQKLTSIPGKWGIKGQKHATVICSTAAQRVDFVEVIINGGEPGTHLLKATLSSVLGLGFEWQMNTTGQICSACLPFPV